MTGESVQRELLKSEDRKSDLALLRDLTACTEADRLWDASKGLTEDEWDAFGDMRDRLEDGTAAILSDKQRKWAEEVADRLGIAFTRRAKERAENVAKGRDVKLVGVLSQDSLKAALMARRR